ncbi:hypothetical protein N7530_012990 [Penicillium desertorum]|uniref:Uncharacterized protein n=1 Tax=Penicillium desertorum TaxID=1303715 RepID=A0A9W9WD18_9EURO|nr:hypothetical protein N7530_012990 [Penicillium desertorum]
MQGACSIRPPHQSPRSLAPPGRWPPSTPLPPQAVRRTGESVKSPYPPPRRGGLFTDPPLGEGACSEAPPPPSKAEGAPPVRAPRASRLARRLRLPSTSPALHPARRCGQLPPPRQLAPHAPLPRAAKHRRPPLARGWGRGGPPVAHGYVGTGVPGGSYREGHPARAPTVRSPAMPASLTQRNAATLADPHSLSPGPLGPGRFYTDSPTPFGSFGHAFGAEPPPKAPGKVAPLRPSSPGPPPPTMTMPYLLPRRGGLFTDPPPPGGRGLALQCLLSKTPPPHLPGKAAPSTPAPEPPGQAVERTGESPKVTISSPNPRGGGGLSTGHTGRGGMLYTIPPSNAPPPRTARKACPFDPPRFDPRPSRRANWPIPKGTISLPRARGLANDPPCRRDLAL